MLSQIILVVSQEKNMSEYGELLPPVVEYFLPETGLEAAKERNADLLVLDCGSETDHGLTLLKEIKSARFGLPVIFVTDASSEKVAIAAFKSGARDYFWKPLDPLEFKKSVCTILHFKCSPLEKLLNLSAGDNDGALEKLRTAGDMPESINRAICFIERNLNDELKLEQIAAEACMSKYHFSRQFKKYVGVSPVQFIINVRIRRAIELLRNMDLSVSVVAAQAGFNDLSEFNKQFKKITGIAPSTFRKSISA